MSKAQIREVIASAFVMLLVVVSLYLALVPGMVKESQAYKEDQWVISLETGVVTDKSYHSLTDGLEQEILMGYFIVIEGPVALSSGEVIEASREIQVDKLTWDSIEVGDIYE